MGGRVYKLKQLPLEGVLALLRLCVLGGRL